MGPEAMVGARRTDALPAIRRAWAGARPAMHAAPPVPHGGTTACGSGAGEGAAAGRGGRIAPRRPIFQPASGLVLGALDRVAYGRHWDRIPVGARHATVLPLVQAAQHAGQGPREVRRAAEQAGGQRGRLVVLSGAAIARQGCVVGEDHVGGEHRLDRLLGVERAEGNDGRGHAVGLRLDRLALGRGQRGHHRAQRVVGEQRGKEVSIDLGAASARPVGVTGTEAASRVGLVRRVGWLWVGGIGL